MHKQEAFTFSLVQHDTSTTKKLVGSTAERLAARHVKPCSFMQAPSLKGAQHTPVLVVSS
jgi:hypothetical protein